jgi:hypothetical protein
MTYQIQGFQSINTDRGYDAERSADTVKEARREAKYMLSDEYRRASEVSDKLAKVQIWKGEELIDEMEG